MWIWEENTIRFQDGDKRLAEFGRSVQCLEEGRQVLREAVCSKERRWGTHSGRGTRLETEKLVFLLFASTVPLCCWPYVCRYLQVVIRWSWPRMWWWPALFLCSVYQGCLLTFTNLLTRWDPETTGNNKHPLMEMTGQGHMYAFLSVIVQRETHFWDLACCVLLKARQAHFRGVSEFTVSMIWSLDRSVKFRLGVFSESRGEIIVCFAITDVQNDTD